MCLVGYGVGKERMTKEIRKIKGGSDRRDVGSHDFLDVVPPMRYIALISYAHWLLARQSHLLAGIV